ncbi:MAG: hypothetical protein Q7J15_13595 [Candidatus Desulfaltia sp.]|nr:hypothetical protein [Candidatus Desulfaltia sp.]
MNQKTGTDSTGFEPQKRAHSPLLAAGNASESKKGKLPYGRRFPTACGGELQLYVFVRLSGSISGSFGKELAFKKTNKN